MSVVNHHFERSLSVFHDKENLEPQATYTYTDMPILVSTTCILSVPLLSPILVYATMSVQIKQDGSVRAKPKLPGSDNGTQIGAIALSFRERCSYPGILVARPMRFPQSAGTVQYLTYPI